MRKIAIIGCGGAGKSTLARRLGELLSLPVIHLDAEFWQPGWKMISKEDERILLKKLIDQESWIMDGNYGSTMPLRFAAADTIIFLDFPTLLCLWRVIRRRIQYWGTSRPDMNSGCLEKLDWSFLTWILTYKAVRRPQVIQQLSEYEANRRILIFKRPKQMECFLSNLTINQSCPR